MNGELDGVSPPACVRSVRVRRRSRDGFAVDGPLLATIFDSMSSGVLVADRDGDLLLVNAAGRKCLGLEAGEPVAGRSVSDLSRGAEALLQETPPGQQREACIDLGGRPLRLGFTSVTIADSGQQVTVFRDLTEVVAERRRRDRAEDLAQVGEMLAVLSHELKNPLASVSAGLQVLQNDPYMDNSSRRVVDEVLDQVRALSTTLRQLLAPLRGRRIRPTPTRLGAALRPLLTTFVPLAAERYVGLESRLADEDADLVLDAEWFGRAVTNLLLNAMQAVGQGGRVTLSSRLLNEQRRRRLFGQFPNEVVEVSVHDNGTGIDSDHLQRIFQPFFSTKSTGTGLGLPLTREVVEAHGGVVAVDSSPGIGTTFSIFLPSHRPVPCWDAIDCQRLPDSCAVRARGGGLCCWSVSHEGLMEGSAACQQACYSCELFRRTNLGPHLVRAEFQLVGG